MGKTIFTPPMIRFMHSNGPSYGCAYIPWPCEIIDVSGDVHLNPALYPLPSIPGCPDES